MLCVIGVCPDIGADVQLHSLVDYFIKEILMLIVAKMYAQMADHYKSQYRAVNMLVLNPCNP